ncbi:FAD-binding domain-containing protein 19 [Elsinoe australis]|uniref:FAD-binding domain-containing protein 19 n=1 Tax=Elsinoe australis TaxID=40998 RepID=A0A4U7AZ08_9PEZI|nr:FAD-binding domain-containing protein 19 [Elsinoe australis]
MVLKVVIIGAGLGGLAAAVSLKFEDPSHSIGAGLQLTPNCTRLLQRWGLNPVLEPLATKPEVFTIHRYNGDLLGRREGYGDEMLAKYRSNFWDMHRADLQRVLYEKAQELGVEFRFGAQVVEHRLDVPEVTLKNGDCITGDVVVAADGLWSRTRAALLAAPSPPIPTGDLAYRIVLPVTDIRDPELRRHISTPRVSMWVGPGCHTIMYPLKNNTQVNVVLLVPDTLPAGVAKASGDLDEMRGLFEEWDPRLKTLLSYVTSVDKWKLMHLTELPNWHNPTATAVFLGDACHPMLPYLAQGAGSAIEDGATLGILLSKVKRREELKGTLEVYEKLRKPRSSELQSMAVRQRHINHMVDGEEQRARDELVRKQKDEPQEGYPFYWLDPGLQGYVYGYDVIEELKKVGVSCRAV